MAFGISLRSSLFCIALLQLADFVHGGNASEPPLTPITRDLYHSSDSLLKEIKELVHRYPEKLMVETMRASNKGYTAEILSFGQHGRELITSEVALRLLSILSGEHTIPSMDSASLSSVLENLVIKVVPVENLNGRKLVEAGDLCERRNGRGVDLNRNWSVDWGKKEKDYDPNEENPGTAPFSEPETQMMRKISKSFDPHIWVNIHSGMEALFMPYDHKNITPDGIISQLSKELLDGLNHRHFHDRCMVGSGGGSVGYLAHGTSTDYMHDVVKVPMAFTFELYGDLLASTKDCFKMFNPIDEPTFNRVVDTWCAALLMLFETGPRCLERAKRLSASSSEAPNRISKRDGKTIWNSGISQEMRSHEGGFELGMHDLRTYFRFFLLSSVLLIFMFCSRLSLRSRAVRDHFHPNF